MRLWESQAQSENNLRSGATYVLHNSILFSKEKFIKIYEKLENYGII